MRRGFDGEIRGLYGGIRTLGWCLAGLWEADCVGEGEREDGPPNMDLLVIGRELRWRWNEEGGVGSADSRAGNEGRVESKDDLTEGPDDDGLELLPDEKGFCLEVDDVRELKWPSAEGSGSEPDSR